MTLSEISYQGSKSRFMKVLKPLIENNLDEGMTYVEPFGGGMNSFTPINASKKIANDVNEYNIEQVKENCHQVNKDAKLVKLYILDEVIIASAEIYYLAEEDFNFQMNNALKQLIAAKTMYKKLDN